MWLYTSYEVDTYLELELEKNTKNLNMVHMQNKAVADVIVTTLIDTPEVIALFKDAAKANTQTQKKIRQELYELLKHDYYKFRQYNIQQLHFHLPNLDSFLRFHRPYKFGDNLKGIRNTVEYVSRFQSATYTFEEGKVFNGFRAIYPLFYEGEYIGSVEVSHSSQSFKHLYERAFNQDVDFVIRRDVVESKVFNEELKNYHSYPLNSNFLYQKSMKISANTRELLKQMDHDVEVISKMDKMESFITYVKDTTQGVYYMATFYVVKNLHAKRDSAYFITYQKSPYIDRIFKIFYIQLTLVFILSLVIVAIYNKGMLIYFRSLYKAGKLQKRDKIIFNSSKDMIIVLNKEGIVDANNQLLYFFEVDNVSSLGMVKSSLEKIFLHEEGCFHPDTYKSAFWVESILKLNTEERVVALLDKNAVKRFFQLNISVIKENSEWLVLFSEITQSREKYLQLEQKAYIDNLTNAYNRQYLLETYTQMIEANPNEDISIILFDIDHFKKINDTHGHAVGDATLKHLVQTVKLNIRHDDVFARWGGEEFIVLVNTNEKGAYRLAEHLRQAIEEDVSEDDTIPAITCSFGIAYIDKKHSFTEAFNIADMNLYEAKKNGRNRVIV